MDGREVAQLSSGVNWNGSHHKRDLDQMYRVSGEKDIFDTSQENGEQMDDNHRSEGENGRGIDGKLSPEHKVQRRGNGGQVTRGSMDQDEPELKSASLKRPASLSEGGEPWNRRDDMITREIATPVVVQNNSPTLSMEMEGSRSTGRRTTSSSVAGSSSSKVVGGDIRGGKVPVAESVSSSQTSHIAPSATSTTSSLPIQQAQFQVEQSTANELFAAQQQHQRQQRQQQQAQMWAAAAAAAANLGGQFPSQQHVGATSLMMMSHVAAQDPTLALRQQVQQSGGMAMSIFPHGSGPAGQFPAGGYPQMGQTPGQLQGYASWPTAPQQLAGGSGMVQTMPVAQVSPGFTNSRSACDHCRKTHGRAGRCDRVVPCCHCKKRGIPCTYSAQRRRGPKPGTLSQRRKGSAGGTTAERSEPRSDRTTPSSISNQGGSKSDSTGKKNKETPTNSSGGGTATSTPASKGKGKGKGKGKKSKAGHSKTNSNSSSTGSNASRPNNKQVEQQVIEEDAEDFDGGDHGDIARLEADEVNAPTDPSGRVMRTVTRTTTTTTTVKRTTRKKGRGVTKKPKPAPKTDTTLRGATTTAEDHRDTRARTSDSGSQIKSDSNTTSGSGRAQTKTVVETTTMMCTDQGTQTTPPQSPDDEDGGGNNGGGASDGGSSNGDGAGPGVSDDSGGSRQANSATHPGSKPPGSGKRRTSRKRYHNHRGTKGISVSTSTSGD